MARSLDVGVFDRIIAQNWREKRFA